MKWGNAKGSRQKAKQVHCVFYIISSGLKRLSNGSKDIFQSDAFPKVIVYTSSTNQNEKIGTCYQLIRILALRTRSREKDRLRSRSHLGPLLDFLSPSSTSTEVNSSVVARRSHRSRKRGAVATFCTLFNARQTHFQSLREAVIASRRA